MKNGAKRKKIRGSFENDVVKVCRALDRHRAKYIIIGGIACNLHGLIRATKDIDILIPKDVKNAANVIGALKEALMFGIAGETDIAKVAKGPITVIGDVPRVDLVTTAGRVKYEEAIKNARHVKINGVKINFVDLDTLLKTKNTDRLQDKADIERLKKIGK